MGAGTFIRKAERTDAMPSRGLSRFDHCTCHPRAYGLKKGLRRARRRLGQSIIRKEVRSVDD